MTLANSSLTQIIFDEIPSPNLKVSVIIPAKDEADYILKALDALRSQVDELGKTFKKECYEVLVLANNCIDKTYEICKAYQSEHPSFQLAILKVEIASPYAHIGTVRRLLMDAAYERLMNVRGDQGIIASTDADTEVHPQWIFQIINEIDRGADMVGGRILSRETPSLSKAHHLRDVTYRILKSKLEFEIDPNNYDPWPRHHQCFGASLAVSCETYERSGRLPVLPYLEDEAFRKAVSRIDAKIRHSPKVIVYTSSRLIGKVDIGFSGQLKEWEAMSLNENQQMEVSFESLRRQFSMKNKLREVWIAVREGQPTPFIDTTLLNRIGIDYHQLISLVTDHIYFESLWEFITQHSATHQDIRMVPVTDAIKELRHYFANRMA